MKLQINDKAYEVQADADTPLLWVIRDELGLTGTKYGCGLAQCGACSVMVDGAVVRSCVTPIEGMAGRKITTIEAITEDDVGKKVVDAWVKHQVPQCGYCQSGQVMAATALLKQVKQPTNEQIAAAMVNLCRCGTYNAISAAVHDLAGITVAHSSAVASQTVKPTEHTLNKTVAAATVAVAGIGTVAAIHWKKSQKSKAEGDES
jgi:isoquinoline 1-oxidoreductase alpha subunit